MIYRLEFLITVSILRRAISFAASRRRISQGSSMHTHVVDGINALCRRRGSIRGISYSAHLRD